MASHFEAPALSKRQRFEWAGLGQDECSIIPHAWQQFGNLLGSDDSANQGTRRQNSEGFKEISHKQAADPFDPRGTELRPHGQSNNI